MSVSVPDRLKPPPEGSSVSSLSTASFNHLKARRKTLSEVPAIRRPPAECAYGVHVSKMNVRSRGSSADFSLRVSLVSSDFRRLLSSNRLLLSHIPGMERALFVFERRREFREVTLQHGDHRVVFNPVDPFLRVHLGSIVF